ncbi:MAG: alpha-1,2-fucosyltransferase [Selenomonadaceae bacterium]|nr:alpha-1,2-fucosyltransferase [Selenomonadaceae bacterium]
MIISKIGGGIGNQLFQYAAGRRLAHKLNTEFKIEKLGYVEGKFPQFVLDKLNITSSFASPEEIKQLKKNCEGTSIGIEKNVMNAKFMPEVLDYPDNIYVSGYWENERYFADIADILRQEFTLKQPLGSIAQNWKEKILAADCSVSLHVRHGDFIQNSKFPMFAILPLDYYYECIEILKQQYKNLTLFIFSNDLQWVKENLRAGVPMEFVEGENLQDVEEIYLMSFCKHNIIANSTFSWWGAWLNQNPDKKVFVPIPSSILGTKETYRHFSAERNENSPFDSDRWIRIPFDLNNQSASFTIHPYFSILLVVNNNIDTIVESLNTIIGQDYKFFELIIIDNASTDDSGKICKQVAKEYDNITLIKLHDKVQNEAAWNKALDVAQGDFILFLKGNDRILVNTISYFCLMQGKRDVFNSVSWLKENEQGDISINDKKFSMERISAFQNLDGIFHGKLDKLTLLRILTNNEVFPPLETMIFKRKFLMENKIRFNEKIGADAELLFTLDAMFQTDEIIFTSTPCYVAPKDEIQS